MAPYQMDYQLNRLPAAGGIRDLCSRNFNSSKPTQPGARSRAPQETYGRCNGSTDECFAGFA